jgi:hypothetical protein
MVEKPPFYEQHWMGLSIHTSNNSPGAELCAGGTGRVRSLRFGHQTGACLESLFGLFHACAHSLPFAGCLPSTLATHGRTGLKKHQVLHFADRQSGCWFQSRFVGAAGVLSLRARFSSGSIYEPEP